MPYRDATRCSQPTGKEALAPYGKACNGTEALEPRRGCSPRQRCPALPTQARPPPAPLPPLPQTPLQGHPTGPQRRPGSQAGAPEATDEPQDKAAERPGPGSGRAEGSGAAGSGATHPAPQRAQHGFPRRPAVAP